MEKKPFESSSSQPNKNSPPSSFRPKLNDQDYLELVCENGQILAKTRRPKNSGSFQNQRTQSLLDLYETEYDENFKNNIRSFGDTQVVPVNKSQQQQDQQTNKRVISSTLIDDSAKNAPPDEQSAAVGRSTELYFASSSMFSQETSTDLSCCSLKRKYEDIEEEESTYLSNNSDDESDDAKTQVLTRAREIMTKRKRSTELSRLSERKRRDHINKKMRALQDLLPNCYKEDRASLLDEAIKYMKTLQLQVQMMSMGNGLIRPPTMLPLMSHYSPSLHMNGAVSAMPQFLHMNVHGIGFQATNNASSPQMLSFLNHSTGLNPNSPMFYPMEHSSQQFVVPSCVPQTQATTSFTQFPKSASTSNLEDSMQFRGSNGYYR